MTKDLGAQARAAVKKYGTRTAAAKALGLPRTTLNSRLEHGEARENAQPMDPQDRPDLYDLLKAKPRHIAQLVQKLGMSEDEVLAACTHLQKRGFNVFHQGDLVSIEQQPVPRVMRGQGLFEFPADKRNRTRFGVVSDNHLCSKYARLDVLYDLYDWFAKEGITRVYNAGNWIDGEARFNRFDLLVHGMQQQVNYFCEKYPMRKGITTYFVAGDDHEGWYCKDVGVDIGMLTERTAIDEYGRSDLRYLGYMEAFISLVNQQGRTSQLMVVHPGGGSSYAISYAPQKFIESLQGGEKPAAVIFGHWHKMEVLNYRNVWSIQAGTTEDQTPFMRKKKLEAHVGGLIVELEQDEHGAVIACRTEQRRYFDRAYHNGSYSMSGPITHPPLQRKTK